METQILEIMASDFGLSLNSFIIILVVATIWQMIWKGIALWKSAGLRQREWFIAILLINSLGILEMYYIFFVAKKYRVEVEERSE